MPKMVKACNEIVAKHGLVAEALGIQVMELRWNFEFGVRVSIPLPDGSTLDPEKVRFQALAERQHDGARGAPPALQGLGIEALGRVPCLRHLWTLMVSAGVSTFLGW